MSIKYKNDKGKLLTLCPFNIYFAHVPRTITAKVGGRTCKKCEHFIKADHSKNLVWCNLERKAKIKELRRLVDERNAD